MQNTTTPQIIDALHGALSSALDNLPDLFDGSFTPAELAACCMDIAALQHLVSTGPDELPNIVAYL